MGVLGLVFGSRSAVLSSDARQTRKDDPGRALAPQRSVDRHKGGGGGGRTLRRVSSDRPDMFEKSVHHVQGLGMWGPKAGYGASRYSLGLPGKVWRMIRLPHW
jgi:hypothetical protein